MKRFYEDVAVKTVEGGVAVTLDGKAVKTPAKRPLVLPNELIAKSIAREWAAQGQGELIDSYSMPLMQLAAAAIDQVADERCSVVDEISAYGGTDLICYRAAEPEDLKTRQNEGWQPLLDWCETHLGAKLAVTMGVIAVEQDSAALEALRAAVEGYDNMSLAALHTMTSASGSLVIALALAEGHIDARTAWLLSRIDERFQAENWGLDEEAKAGDDRLRATLFASARFLRLCNHDKLAAERGSP